MRTPDFFDLDPSDETAIACDLSALDDPEHHGRASEALFAERDEMLKVPGGYAFRYPATSEYAERLLDFIGRERECCPFLTFKIIFEPEGRGVWLWLGGNEHVEAYLVSQFEALAS